MTKSHGPLRCAICFNNIYMGKSQIIHGIIYKKLSQTQVTRRLHKGKSSYPKYEKTLLLPCDHLFHQKCIKKWYRRNPTCPLCRN